MTKLELHDKTSMTITTRATLATSTATLITLSFILSIASSSSIYTKIPTAPSSTCYPDASETTQYSVRSVQRCAARCSVLPTCKRFNYYYQSNVYGTAGDCCLFPSSNCQDVPSITGFLAYVDHVESKINRNYRNDMEARLSNSDAALKKFWKTENGQKNCAPQSNYYVGMPNPTSTTTASTLKTTTTAPSYDCLTVNPCLNVNYATNPSGLYPHVNTNMYIQCSNNICYARNCSSTLLYDDSKKTCA
ncbi:hypothetical protein HELRODRAFT_179527 [Helobdella robusta]|uniref:Uncharacterized protein n=1 Tax=Helobdella robusta TaxID=6412 RepID=T1FEU6_HELRO|nr:hypothetical protein HELRODRAFT_179527 [Helobdella robusta]ESN95200.1 hypothetical protein HELRODRAFT_179527 [Helobdella robusta]